MRARTAPARIKMHTTASAKTPRFGVGEWLEYQKSIHPAEIQLGLERISRVAEGMGILPPPCPVITVAGTNGKGSTVAMFESILTAAGYKTASYTSPHLHRYNERIKVAGRCISDDELCKAFAVVEANRGQTSLSFFEYGTLAALYRFQHDRPDVIILETGLGGRLDAVNIVDADMAVITSIGIDHTEWLGKDRQSIAREKAGITREGRTCICGDGNPPAAITDLSGKGVLLECLGRDFSHHKKDNGWDFVFRDRTLGNLPMPALFGDIQLANASCVLAGLACLEDRLPVGYDAIRRGLTAIDLSGRFQIETITGPGGRFVAVFDIAHNPQGSAVMASNLAQLPGEGRLHAVFSIFSTKDVNAVMETVKDSVDYWYLGRNASPYAMPVGRLRGLVGEYAGEDRIFTAGSVAAAYRKAVGQLHPGDKLLVFGSMLTVSEALTAARIA